MDNFPDEIITIILSNLPVKSIMQCRSVCQTWRAIIDNPSFVELHFNTSTTSESGNATSLIFIPNFLDEIYTAREDIKVPGDLKTTKIDISLEVRISNLIEPPVNGLVFMYSSIYYNCSSGRDSSMFICNPATRNVVKLPSCNPIQFKRAQLVRGFGFDKVNQEFKAVQIVSSVFNWTNGTASEVQVYTLGSNSWVNIGRTPDVLFFNGSVFVNGASHWLTQNKLQDGIIPPFSMSIVSFHLTSLEFSFIPTPEFGFLENPDFEFNSEKIQLVGLGECLSIVDSTFEDHIDVWVMKDHNAMESWTRFSVTKYYMDNLRFTVVQLISFLRNDSEIVLLYGSSRLVAYNIHYRSFRSLEIDGLPGYSLRYGISPNFYKVYAYDESLHAPRPTKVEQPL
ncbi:hypothetical protein ACHQM5_004079 [Ranunculus cassubicifolius]